MAKKAGRPSKFDTIDMDKVRILATRGWTDEDMAKFFNVALSTWSNWKVDQPGFLEALKDWKIEADSRVERSLYERAIGYKCKDTHFATFKGEITDEREYVKEYAPDTTACIFWLKNRQRDQWRDKQEIESTNYNLDMTDDELQAKAKELLERAKNNE